MAVPAFSPAGGVGSQTSSGGIVYQFGKGGWKPVASGGGTKPPEPKPPAPPPKPQGQKQQQTTQQMMQQPAYQVPSGPSDADMQREIENAYNEQMNYLANVEGRLRPDYESALGEAQKAFEAQQSMLGGQRTQARGTLEEQGIRGQQAYESALTEARRLYDQLQRGYQQRFGGSSSAGQAATEISNVERMRQQGQNYRTLQDVNRQVQSGLQNIEQQYNSSLLQLEQNKQAAINQARRDFTDKLNQIDQMRMQAGTNKSQAKLQALQNLRNQVLQIEAENRQFQKNLDLYKAQAQIQLEANAKSGTTTTSAVTTGVQNALQNFGTGTLPNLTIGSPTTTTGSNLLTSAGQITPRRLSELELGLPYTALPSAGLTSRMI